MNLPRLILPASLCLGLTAALPGRADAGWPRGARVTTVHSSMDRGDQRTAHIIRVTAHEKLHITVTMQLPGPGIDAAVGPSGRPFVLRKDGTRTDIYAEGWGPRISDATARAYTTLTCSSIWPPLALGLLWGECPKPHRGMKPAVTVGT